MVTYGLTRALLANLEQEFEAQVSAGKSRSDALKIAAQKILHAAG